MPSTRVINLKLKEPYDLYVGRRMPGLPGSPFANPYRIGRDGTREDVLQKFEHYLIRFRPDLLDRVHELQGLVLGCWCAPPGGLSGNDPLVCHGQVLAKLADNQD